MRPDLVAWLAARGVPEWIAPDYMLLVAVAAGVCAFLTLRLTRSDGAEVHHAARALALAYVGALAGGYVFEALRRVPEAIETLSPWPVLLAGRAAYGGLIAGIGAPWAYLRWQKLSVGAFFDRVSTGTGLVFLFVRAGCFLEGCDYGLPTQHAWGVRFPPRSLAALDHASRGWIPIDARSLPVHPTQLFEAALGALGAAVSFVLVRRWRERDGRVFLVFLTVYAAGRFAIEFARGDAERGRYAGLSTAQVVSLVFVAVVLRLAWRLRTNRAATTSIGELQHDKGMG